MPSPRPRTSRGSSPRARGTLRQCSTSSHEDRFIPASAGNTAPRTRAAGCPSVHPRERGEHPRNCRARSSSSGSSPRARGTPVHRRQPAFAGRFIPASAGNTVAGSRRAGRRTVHPRERGEHCAPRLATERTTGSSPRARGTHPAQGHWREAKRFIPASAGNTSRARSRG